MRDGAMTETISRSLANWVAALEPQDVPGEVSERMRALLLQGMISALLGHDTPEGAQARALVAAEDGPTDPGATLLHCGGRSSRTGAAYANSEMMFAGGKWDTYRMLTHPGCAILPAALAAAETTGCSGARFLLGVTAGYEVLTRLARDLVPTLMSRGFHAGPVFGLFGAAVAVAKIRGQDAEQIHATISQCVNLASGNLEGARSGGRGVREGAAVRNAIFAAALGEQGIGGGDTVFEGPAGFLHAYVGSATGQLRYSFDGQLAADLPAITAGLGQDWVCLGTLFRIYATPGYNNAHVPVTAALCAEHDIRPEQVARIDCTVNWLETQYPSPAFPSERTDLRAGPERPHYFAAHAVLTRDFPLDKYPARGWGGEDPAGLVEMMAKVQVTPSHGQPLFSPRVTITTTEGRAVSRQATGQELFFGLDDLAERLRAVLPRTGLTPDGYAALVAACAGVGSAPDVGALVSACLIER